MIEVFLILLVFFIRLFPRLLKSDKTDSDTWYHLSSAVSIYNNKYKLPACNEGFTLGGKYDYPFLAHWIVAVLSGKNILKFERFIGPIVDTIYVIIGFFYFSFLLSYYNIKVENQLINFLLLLVFSSTMLKISTGPRVYSFTPRIFGELFIFIFLLGLHLYLLTNNTFFIVLSIIFGGLVLNTSTFGSQVLVFFSILLSLLLLTFMPIFVLFMASIFAWISSKGHYKQILLQQLKFTKEYALYGQYHHPALLYRNKFPQYIQFFKSLWALEIRDAYIIFQRDLTFFNVFYKNFEFMLLVVLLPWFTIFDNFFFQYIYLLYLFFY